MKEINQEGQTEPFPPTSLPSLTLSRKRKEERKKKKPPEIKKLKKSVYRILYNYVFNLISDDLKKETRLLKSSTYSLMTFKKPKSVEHCTNMKIIFFSHFLALNKLWARRKSISRCIWNM